MSEQQQQALARLEEVRLDIAPEWLAKRDEAVAMARAVAAVDDDVGLEVAGRVQTALSGLAKDLEAQRMAITRPLDGIKKAIMDKAAELTAPVNAELARIKTMNTAYATRKAKEAEAERRRLLKIQQERAEAEARAQIERDNKARADAEAVFGPGAKVEGAEPPPPNAFEPPVAAVIPQASMPRTSANAFTEVWKFEVLDADKVPRELCSVDETKIRAALNYQKSLKRNAEDVVISGLRIYKEMSVRAR